VPYQAWAREGFLTATVGNQTDYNVIEREIVALRDVHGLNIAEISFDGWNAAQITSTLAETYGFAMIKTPQSLMQMSAPTKEFLRRIKGGTLKHPRNPLLRWAASNAAVHYSGKLQMDADLETILDKVPIMFSKQSSGDKIDPVCAVALAFKSMIAHPDQWGTSVYASAREGEMVL
jgi:phage terminase large subunit-like protein